MQYMVGLWQERDAGALSEEGVVGGDSRSTFVRFGKNCESLLLSFASCRISSSASLLSSV